MLSNEAIVQRTFRAIDHGVAVIAFIGRVARVNHFRLRIFAVCLFEPAKIGIPGKVLYSHFPFSCW